MKDFLRAIPAVWSVLALAGCAGSSAPHVEITIDPGGEPARAASRVAVKNMDDDNGDGLLDIDQFNVAGENNLVPVLITISGSSDGTATVTLPRGPSRVKVWKTETKQGAFDVLLFDGDHRFPVAGPTTLTLYLEGVEESKNTDDIELAVTHKGVTATRTFTVLWVTLAARFGETETLSADNQAREHFRLRGANDDYGMGSQLREDRVGRTMEIVGEVKPADFALPVSLHRDHNSVVFEEVPGMERQLVTRTRFSTPEPVRRGSAGNDISPLDFRDDDPQSGLSSGRIYDVDTPGVAIAPRYFDGTVVRSRSNFKAFAVFRDQRASHFFYWSSARSYKLPAAPLTPRFEGGTRTTATDSDVKNGIDADPQSPDWTPDAWAKSAVCLIDELGSCAEQTHRIIRSNTKDVLTVNRPWDTAPGKTLYKITTRDTWVVEESVPGDNKLKAHHTKEAGWIALTWNLQ